MRSVLVLLVSTLAGCHWHKAPPPLGPTSAPQAVEHWTSTPMQVPPAPVLPVKQGLSPQVYLVETAAMVRIVDATTGEELLKVPVPAHTVIAINAASGIQVGGATMKLGPLPADHQYAIYLESSEENIIRQGTIRPGS